MSLLEVEVPADYVCLICSSNPMNKFVESRACGGPICIMCNAAIEIQVTVNQFRDDPVIGIVEKKTGRIWENFRVMWLEDDLDYWRTRGADKTEFHNVQLVCEYGWSDEQLAKRAAEHAEKIAILLAEARSNGDLGATP